MLYISSSPQLSHRLQVTLQASLTHVRQTEGNVCEHLNLQMRNFKVQKVKTRVCILDAAPEETVMLIAPSMLASESH